MSCIKQSKFLRLSFTKAIVGQLCIPHPTLSLRLSSHFRLEALAFLQTHVCVCAHHVTSQHDVVLYWASLCRMLACILIVNFLACAQMQVERLPIDMATKLKTLWQPKVSSSTGQVKTGLFVAFCLKSQRCAARQAKEHLVTIYTEAPGTALATQSFVYNLQARKTWVGWLKRVQPQL